MSKKILVLEPYLDLLGGSERMAFEVAKGLAGAGWEIHLGFQRDGVWKERYTAFVRNFHSVPEAVPSFGRPWNLLQSTLRIKRVMQGEGIRILFSSHLGYLTSAALLEKVFGIRSCFHLGLMGTVANTVSGRWAVKQISAGIAPSEHTNKSWERVGWPKERLQVISNWIDWEKYRKLPSKGEARKSLGVDGGRREGAGGRDLKVVAYVGRLVEEKGIEVLLEAWNQGFAEDENALLLIAGTGKAEYEAKLKAKAARNVKLLGGLEDTKPVYRASDFTVVPSLWEEPFGLVPLEAVACGSIPLVSDQGFLPEIVGKKNPQLVHPHGDAMQLKKQLRQFFGHENQELILKLRTESETKFSKESGLRSYQRVLANLF